MVFVGVYYHLFYIHLFSFAIPTEYALLAVIKLITEFCHLCLEGSYAVGLLYAERLQTCEAKRYAEQSRSNYNSLGKVWLVYEIKVKMWQPSVVTTQCDSIWLQLGFLCKFCLNTKHGVYVPDCRVALT